MVSKAHYQTLPPSQVSSRLLNRIPTSFQRKLAARCISSACRLPARIHCASPTGSTGTGKSILKSGRLRCGLYAIQC